MALSSTHPTASTIFYIYFITSIPSRYYAHPYLSKRKNHFRHLKNGSLNKQYDRRMTVDKRFRQNHTKYLRFKAFR